MKRNKGGRFGKYGEQKRLLRLKDKKLDKKYQTNKGSLCERSNKNDSD
jgi:hypothetical protein